MATQKRKVSAKSKPAKATGGHKTLKTAGVLAAIGLAAVGVAKARKTPRGRAIEKKVMTKGREVLGKAKGLAEAGTKAARKSASRSG
jgi:hypothetical protein